jgi:hypothetical protein
MGVIIGMFSQVARLGLTRAAAFFYAVAVGVVANVVIAHFSPHPGDQPAAPEIHPAIATATIAAKPALPPVQTIDVKAASTTPPAPPPAAPVITPVAAPVVPATSSPVDASAATSLPSSATMTAPPLKPAAVLSTPVSAAPAPDSKQPDKPANNVEAAAGSTPSAPPISLLPPPDQTGDQPPPKPIKPGPGSGGLY